MSDSKEIIDELISKLGQSESREKNSSDWFPRLERKSEKTRKMEDEENDGILKRRNRWSNWVLFFIGVIIVFDIILVVLYGRNILNFADPTVVIVIITDNFLKIFGLGFLITRETFKKIY